MELVIKYGYEPDFNDYSIGNDLPVCPVCGAKAFLNHDICDGFDYGWSVGCPKVYNDDNVHGIDRKTNAEDRFSAYSMDSLEDCVDWWIGRCSRYE